MKDRKKERKRSGAPNEPWAEYCGFTGNMTGKNAVKLLVDGEQAYPAMLSAISSAKKTVLMDSYIFHGDPAGKLFAEALSERARNGVQVFLTVDGVGTLNVASDFFGALEQAGVNVLIYRSPAPWRRSFGLLKRNHRKLLVVDGETGFAGGLNIGEEWLPKSMEGKGWHDVHIMVKGPAVRELSLLALATWKEHSNRRIERQAFLPDIDPAGIEYVNIIGSRERKKGKSIRKSYLKAIKQARDYIYIANAYFLPDSRFRRALKKACRRGVDVRLMVPRRGDILPFQLASEAIWSKVLKAGMRIFLWEDAVLHAKTAVVDDQWATVGSFNLDHRSWTMNLEVNVVTVGPRISADLKKLFLQDQERCTELILADWQKRGLFLKLLQSFFFLFRKLM